MIKKHSSILVASIATLLLYVNLVDPRTIPPVATFAVFGLLYVVFSQLLIVALAGLRYVLLTKWQTSTIRRVAYSLALLPTFLLLLQSVGQLTVRDALLASALTVLLYAYTYRMGLKSIGSNTTE
jgi:hypothetical protein